MVALISVFFLLAIVSQIYFSKQTYELSKQSSSNQIPATQENIDVCIDDQDCIIVPYSSCCGSTKRAINKKNKELYDSHPEWQKLSNPSICNVIGMCADDTGVNKAICEGQDAVKRCAMVF